MIDQLGLFNASEHEEKEKSHESTARFAQQNPMVFNLAKTVAAEIDEPKEAGLAFYSLLLLGHCLQQGHVCIDVNVFEKTQALTEYGLSYRFPDTKTWLDFLRIQSFVSCKVSTRHKSCLQAPLSQLPLCQLYEGKLYFSKWADWEQRLAVQLLLRAQLSLPVNKLPEQEAKTFNWQDVAVQNSLLSPLSIIVGGPGTGKTTTVASILQAVLLQADDEAYRIALAAPTGKAAARMATALKDKIQSSNFPDKFKSCVPDSALTLHRLLGWSYHTRQYRYHKNNRLLLDCIIVDEVSMIDMAMFVALLEALPENCRVILLGDPYQLSSVAAGSVLSQICQPQILSVFSSERCQQHRSCFPSLKNATAQALMDNIVYLQHSYRFDKEAGIGLMADACLSGDDKAMKMAYLEKEVSFLSKTEPQSSQKIIDLLLIQHKNVIAACGVKEAFTRLAQFQLLCAIKEGDFSTAFYNEAMAKLLDSQAQKDSLAMYHGMPVMMEKNHHALGLYNGDMGLLWMREGQLWLYFILADNSLAEFLPLQIQGWRAAHAITVHKSQGSEYNEVAFVCPPQDSRLLNREMVYTAITRSKKHFYCLAHEAELVAAIKQPCIRTSGLSQRLSAGFTD